MARVAVLIAVIASAATLGVGTASASPAFVCHPQPNCRFTA
jgi:hypothetical protein